MAIPDIHEQGYRGIVLTSLPVEIILEITPHIPFSPSQFQTLRNISPIFESAIASHEKSLVNAIRGRQYTESTIASFPGFSQSYTGLSTLHSRLYTISGLSDLWPRLTTGNADLAWLRDRWLTIYKLGTLLLYRLQDCSTHDARTDLLNALPATSLATLYFTLYSSVKVLRHHGPEPINGSYSKDDTEARADIELAFEEMLLQHGPEFFLSLLHAGERQGSEEPGWAVSALDREVTTIEWRQLHSHTPTLISTLRSSFAAKMECRICENTSKMWEVLSGTMFDNVSDEVTVMVVNGEVLKGGMRRMGL
ncbi:hypothetical protein B0A48_15787 [Cryoendolithus antarcticus]|uniref:F-box domain-containing protein n=1 Tax=Cryoendolithus antarcticus TaxID=1507870 RepID=A0A1V8SHA9_9PEZI|nr:hypothetical protein B0A48_15787 [Cryoendolithus antarcticus]